MNGQAPRLDIRDADDVRREMLARRPAFVPAWKPGKEGPGSALLHVFARYAQALIQRLNQAPDKNKLAFLDLMGVDLLPAQAARAPVVFRALPNLGDSRIPKGARVGAPVQGQADPIVFETEDAIALAAARLCEVVTVRPDRDAYADHSHDATGGRAFQLFRPLQRIPHVIYLAHDTLFAFADQTRVEIEFELALPSRDELPAPSRRSRLDVAWEYWNGEAWRALERSGGDGTAGFTRSGTIRLVAPTAEAARTTVNGIDAYWVRGRLRDAFPPEADRALPDVERIHVTTTLARPLSYRTTNQGKLCVGDLVPDSAFGDGARLDLSKAFYPLGRTPDRNSAFYFASEEVFTKAGAEVVVCFRRPRTQQEEGDEIEGKLQDKVNTAAGWIVVAARKAAEGLVDAAAIALKLIEDSDQNPTALQLELFRNYKDSFNGIDELDGLRQQALQLSVAVHQLAGELVDDAEAEKDVFGRALSAASEAVESLNALGRILGDVGGSSPALGSPRLAWEYWNGKRWRSLVPVSKLDSHNFVDSGHVRFTVPDDLASSEVNGVSARWVRARVAAGSFARLRMVSWSEPQSKRINFVPIVEARPPVLEGFYMGYVYSSPRVHAEQCLTLNDFQYEDHTSDARGQGASFLPFQPTADTTPALYLGFDRTLPADVVSLYVDLREGKRPPGPALVWEYWNDEWLPLTVQDETRGLALPGMVSLLWPGQPGPPPADVVTASGTQVLLMDFRQAARFRTGDPVFVSRDGQGEVGTVAGTNRATVSLETPLAQTYVQATLIPAGLSRFGTPRTWIRARLRDAEVPLASHVIGIHANAVWASQVQTFENERLGSSNGEPMQVFFIKQTPILEGEVVEVRELSGPRAEVELPLLREDLRRNGLPEADLRIVPDRRTGRINEAWVRWRAHENLFFSGPDDRHFTIERTRGKLVFGDGTFGRIPPPGTDNVWARRYRSGGGREGSVAKGAISQLLSGVAAQGVTNPREAEGGADGEARRKVLQRGPCLMRHYRQCLSRDDYEALAREASPAIAVARALPAQDAGGRPRPGHVTVVIVPHSREARPRASFGLRQRIKKYMLARAPATLSGLAVVEAEYQPIGVDAVLVPRRAEDGASVKDLALQALRRFLHPLRGGPEGEGWPFGRSVYLSDVAGLLEHIEGMDHVERLQLLANDVPRGEVVSVPNDRIVVAGPLTITLSGGED